MSDEKYKLLVPTLPVHQSDLAVADPKELTAAMRLHRWWNRTKKGSLISLIVTVLCGLLWYFGMDGWYKLIGVISAVATLGCASFLYWKKPELQSNHLPERFLEKIHRILGTVRDHNRALETLTHVIDAQRALRPDDKQAEEYFVKVIRLFGTRKEELDQILGFLNHLRGVTDVDLEGLGRYLSSLDNRSAEEFNQIFGEVMEKLKLDQETGQAVYFITAAPSPSTKTVENNSES